MPPGSAPLLARGGGTSLAGRRSNVAIVIDMSMHLNQVHAIDPDRRLARIEPAAILETLRAAATPFRLCKEADGQK